jgi:hypothetical protein
MAGKQFGGSRFWALGAVYWFVIATLLGLVHFVFPDLVEGPLFVIVAVLLAVVGTFAIVYFARPK